ncbi:MAG: HD domain-containing protein [Bacteroidales bacterium]
MIGWAEGCTDEDTDIKTAGLFHDAGHTIAYDNHEFYGTEMARQFLPAYNYSPEQIDRIWDIGTLQILPQDLLQKIICDSDLDYLGRSDFVPN